METRRLSLKAKLSWTACPTLVLVLCAGCSSALESRQRSSDDDIDLDLPGSGKLRFPNQDLSAKHKAAQADSKSFDSVFDYARAVTVFCQASLIDTSCAACEDGEVRYKRRSELNPHYWPIIEDAIAMVDSLMDGAELKAVQKEQLVSTKGRLLWLAGRSMEEVSLIDGYAYAHPGAVSVVKRRLELLRESGDVHESELQCSRSRDVLKSAPEATRMELLTSCVALHPSNTSGDSAQVDFAKYLLEPTTAEDTLYRTHLVQRCVEDLGYDESRCTESCACMDSRPTFKCKRACRACRQESEQQLSGCKSLAVAPAPAPAPAPVRARSHRPKRSPAARHKPAPRPKVDDPSAPQQAVL